jgi:hypothetical protein
MKEEALQKLWTLLPILKALKGFVDFGCGRP